MVKHLPSMFRVRFTSLSIGKKLKVHGPAIQFFRSKIVTKILSLVVLKQLGRHGKSLIFGDKLIARCPNSKVINIKSQEHIDTVIKYICKQIVFLIFCKQIDKYTEQNEKALRNCRKFL